MKVALISHTPNAEELLVFTKGVRLGATVKRWEDVHNMTTEELHKELRYMADTIPSSWEFVDYTFCIEGVSRAFTHQFVRNRQGSYAQQSLRVVDKGQQLRDDFVMPKRFKNTQYEGYVLDLLDEIEGTVAALQYHGASTEDIRSILPTNISTNIVAKFNLRTMSDLAKSRLGGRTQDEFQSVMTQMVDRVLEVHPWAIDFLLPHGRDYFAEIEAFAEKEYGGDLLKKGELLKIVDKMRKESK
jgi:flavin-dependent thymidylate synthase